MQTVVTVLGGAVGFMIGAAGGPAGAWEGAKWGLTIGAMVGGYLYPPTSGVSRPNVAGLDVTAPQKGQVLPVVYGKQRITGTIIWYGAFTKNESDSGGSGGGGKGGGMETYSAGFAVALGEGQIGSLTKMWANGDPVTLADISYAYYPGIAAPGADPYMAGHLAAGQFNLVYPHVCYVVIEDYDLGYSTAMPNFTFEVVRTTANLVAGNARLTTLGLNAYDEDANGDMNPVTCLADFLTHPRYGLNLPAAELDAASFVEQAAWCETNLLFASPILDTADAGLGHIEHLLSYFDGILIYSEGVFKVRSRRSPAREVLDYTVLDWRDWLEGASPRLSREVDRTMPNSVAVEYLLRTNDYNQAVVERQDDWDVGVRGQYRQQISLPGVTTSAVADLLAAKFLWSRVVAPFTVEFGLGPQGMWYEPGDLIALKGTEFYALEGALMRIVAIKEEPDRTYAITAVEER